MTQTSQLEHQEIDSSRQGVTLALVVSVLALLLLGLLHVWINHERFQLQYVVETMQKEASVLSEEYSKLVIERDFLLSPRQLEKRAQQLGLHNAKPGQLRKIIRHTPAGIMIQDNTGS